MITTLSPEQRKVIPKYYKKWNDQFFKEEFNEELAVKMINWLYSSDKIIDDREIKLIRYACPSTGREYFKYVPDKHTSAIAAIAESHHFSADEYALVSEQT